MSDVTRILNAIEHGDAKAADELLPLVYEELRKLASYKMANEAPGQTLQPTALVHEAWLRLSGNQNQNGMAGAISSPPPPRRCAASSLTRPAVKRLCVTGVSCIEPRSIWGISLRRRRMTNYW